MERCSSASSTLQPLNNLSNDSKDFDWGWADDAFLITTTTSSSDRLERTHEELEKVQLWNKVKVRTFKPDDGDRVRGCYTSHIKILEEISSLYGDRPDYRVIVLEDNLEATLRMDHKTVRAAADFMSSEKDWDVFHLAYMMYVPGLSLHRLPEYRNVVRMLADKGSAVGTSAYVISKRGVAKILAEVSGD